MANKIFLIITITMFMVSTICTARPLMKNSIASSSSSLVYRLKLDGDSPGYCWDSLVQLQHCTGELILFFLNGETYIGPGCCKAIKTIGRKCWPAVFGAIGFTAQESDILQGYCDEHDSDDHGDHIPPPPSPEIFKPENVIYSAP